MAGGGGSVISAEAFKEIKEAMSALVAVSQMQADSLISIQRKADVSELKAERALADKDRKKAGVHTQMEVLEEALYGLDGCDGLVDQCVKGEGAEKSFAPMSESSVQKLHEKLKAMRVVLDKRLVALGIADGAPTMQNGWRACEIWNEGEEACEGVKPSKDTPRRKRESSTRRRHTRSRRTVKERKCLTRAVAGNIRIVRHRKVHNRTIQIV